jgi:Condensation domain
LTAASTNEPVSFPLSLEQESFFGPEPVMSPNISLTHRVEGSLDFATLQRAITLLCERHGALRFRIASDGQTPVQGIASPDLPVPEAPVLVGAEQMWQQVGDAHATPLDLGDEGPLRFRLFQVSPDEHVLSTTVHPAAVDAWGVGIINRELWELYASLRSGEGAGLAELPMTFSDHVRSQHTRGAQLTSGQRSNHLRQLEDMAQLSLPWQRTEEASALFPQQEFTLDPADMNGIARTAKELCVTTPAIFLAGFQLALGLAARAEGGGLSYIYFGRDQSTMEGMAAAMARRVPLGFRMAPTTVLGDFVRQAIQNWAVAVGNSGPPYSSARLVQAARGRRELLEPVFNFQVARDAVAKAGAGQADGRSYVRVEQIQGPQPRPVPMWSQFGSAALFALVTVGDRPAVTAIYDPLEVAESTANDVFGGYEHIMRLIIGGEVSLTIDDLRKSFESAMRR